MAVKKKKKKKKKGKEPPPKDKTHQNKNKIEGLSMEVAEPPPRAKTLDQFFFWPCGGRTTPWPVKRSSSFSFSFLSF
jgi:hypothetical protein